MMEFGSFIQLLAIIGIIGLLAAIILKYTGGGEIFSIFMGALNAFFQFIGRIISMAPRYVQVGIFLMVAVVTLGLVSNWFIASDMVCSEGQLYRSESFLGALSAKFLSNDEATLVGNEGVEEYSQQRQEVYGNWGSFIVIGENAQALPPVSPVYVNTVLVAFPSYAHTSVEEPFSITFENETDDQFNLLEEEKVEMILYRETWTSSLLSGRENDRCYLDDGEDGIGFAGATSRVFADKLATVTYEISSEVIDGVKFWNLDVDYQPQTVISGSTTLEGCPRTPVEGEVLAVAGGIMNEVLDGSIFEIDSDVTGQLGTEDVGWVRMKYFPLEALGGSSDAVSETDGLKKRQSFVESGGFSRVEEFGSDEVVTFTCPVEDPENVKTLVYGLDLFDGATFMLIFVLVALFGLLKAVNII